MASRLSDGQRRALTVVGLTLVIALAHANITGEEYLFDDWHVIEQNPAVRGLDDIPSYFVDISTFSLMPGNRDYRPVWLSFMAVCYWLGGGALWPFHLFGVLLHLAAVLTWYVLSRLLLTSALPAKASDRDRLTIEGAATLGAGLFALHPLATQPVNYFSASSVIMVAVFYFAAFACYLSAQGGGRGQRVTMLLGVSCLCYLLALLSKPIAVTLPVTLLLWELVLNRRRPKSWSWSSLEPTAWRLVPYAAVTFVYLGLRSLVSARSVGVLTDTIASRTGSEFLGGHYLTQTKALVFYYLRLAAWPFRQNVDFEFARVQTAGDPVTWLAVLVLAGIAALVYRYREHRDMVFLVLWFPACLLVTTYLIDLGQTVAEHRMYLSLAGFCTLVGLGTAKLFASFPLQTPTLTLGADTGRRLVAGAVVVVLVGCGLLTRERNAVWASRLTLYEDAAAKGGTWRAVMNYGLALENAGRVDESLPLLQRAVEMGSYAFPHMNLGLAYLRRDQGDLALSHMETAASLFPTLPEAHFNLGYVQQMTGHPEEAEASFLTAISINPQSTEALRLMGEFLQAEQRFDEAIAHYTRITEIDPTLTWAAARVERLREDATSVAGRFNRAFAFQREGQRDQAVELYEAVLLDDPTHRQALFNLGYAYAGGTTEADWQRAVDVFDRLLEAHPDYGEAHFHLATALWSLGDTVRAVAQDRLHLERGVDPGMQNTSRSRIASAER